MTADLVETLPLAHRLALSYAPARAREATLVLLALDERLAAIMRQRGEPVIAQMKLAWWRDRFAQTPEDWPAGEPLLALLAHWPGDVARLGAVVDGWEMLLGERLAEPELLDYAHARTAGWADLSKSFGVGVNGAQRVAARYALADLAFHLDAGDERDSALRVLGNRATTVRLTKPLRALTVLHGLAMRALDKGSADLLEGPGAMALAMRLGITGR
ncbi:MAG: squalene/phytoene synthase family protein [Alteraurantiacibacter sp.]